MMTNLLHFLSLCQQLIKASIKESNNNKHQLAPDSATFMGGIHLQNIYLYVSKELIQKQSWDSMMFCLPFCLTGEGVGAVETMGSSDKSRMGGNQLQTIMAGFIQPLLPAWHFQNQQYAGRRVCLGTWRWPILVVLARFKEWSGPISGWQGGHM